LHGTSWTKKIEFNNIGTSKEYLTLMVSNSGHLRLVFDFGFERQEMVFTDQVERL
jgi:hypothetical protein